MTVRVAALSDNRKTIVLAADKMIGAGHIESEPDIEKAVRLHQDWWVMIPGDDVSPAFDIIDGIRKRLRPFRKPVDIAEVTKIAEEEYAIKRDTAFETAFEMGLCSIQH